MAISLFNPDGGCGALRAPVIAALLLAMPAAYAEQGPKRPGEVTVGPDQMHQIEVSKIEVATLTPLRPAIGQIAFNEDASTNVLTPFSGRVTKVLARAGDTLKQGDPLFEIDSPDVMQAQTDVIAAVQSVEKLRAQLALAKRVLDRLSALLQGAATSQRELDQARSDHASAEADLLSAQSTLASARNRLRVILGDKPAELERVERERTPRPLLTVNAPINGTVISRKIGPGQYVRADAGEALFVISDLTTMWLKAFVAESDIPFVREGQEVEVRVSALPQRSFKAKISTIAAASDPQTRRIIVRSEVPNPDRLLKAEMFATFRVAVGEPQSGPTVPSVSVIREGEKTYVWIEEKPLKFVRRDVVLGVEQNGRVIIREGLQEGENVVSRGAIFVDNEDKQ